MGREYFPQTLCVEFPAKTPFPGQNTGFRVVEMFEDNRSVQSVGKAYKILNYFSSLAIFLFVIRISLAYCIHDRRICGGMFCRFEEALRVEPEFFGENKTIQLMPRD